MLNGNLFSPGYTYKVYTYKKSVLTNERKSRKSAGSNNWEPTVMRAKYEENMCEQQVYLLTSILRRWINTRCQEPNKQIQYVYSQRIGYYIPTL